MIPLFLLNAAIKLVGPKWAKPLIYAGGAILLFLALFGAWKMWLHNHDNGVIETHEQAINNQISAEVNVATEKADAADNKQIAIDQERANQIQEDISHAVENHPAAAHNSAGPASSAVLDRLRHRAR